MMGHFTEKVKYFNFSLALCPLELSPYNPHSWWTKRAYLTEHGKKCWKA
jgi:hypothetical protein